MVPHAVLGSSLNTALLQACNNTRCLCGKTEEGTAIELGIGPCGLLEPQSSKKSLPFIQHHLDY